MGMGDNSSAMGAGTCARRRRAILYVIVGMIGLLPVPQASAGTSNAEALLLRDINAGRAGVGKGALRLHTGLSVRAREHSVAMARSGELNHDGSSQRRTTAAPDPSEKSGAPDDGFVSNGACEDVAYRQVPGESEEQIAKGLYEQWRNSPPHRNCMFDESFTHTVAGIGVVKASDGSYWATLMAVNDKTLPRAAKPTPPSFAKDDPCGSSVDAPALTGPTVVSLAAKDPAGQRVTMSASGLPSWASFTSTPGTTARGRLTVAPSAIDWLVSGPSTAVVTATAATGAKVKCSIVMNPTLI
jgi:uncharacterized protein YkwD